MFEKEVNLLRPIFHLNLNFNLIIQMNFSMNLHLNLHQSYNLMKEKKMWVLRCKLNNQSMYHVKNHSLLMSLVSESITLQTHIIFVFYVRPFKETIILTDNEGTKVRKQLSLNDVWCLFVDERILVN